MIRKIGRLLIVVPLLALVPAAALAQMGPRWGMGRGEGRPERTKEAADITQIKEKPSEPMRQESPPQDRAAIHGATGGPMEHSELSLPFYRERTFLVVIGFILAGAGFFALRLVRRRRGRRSGPVEFINEAVLVVDLVDSTHLATHHGDGLAMRARNLLKDRTLEAARRHGLSFAENTGDGYFMTFPSVVSAVKTAVILLKDLKDRPSDFPSGLHLDVRAGISYGEILLDGRAARHGASINKAFRLAGVRPESFVPVEGETELSEIPDRNRIFLDEEAALELPSVGIPLGPVGFCRLKGFSGLHRVFEVVWDKRDYA